VLVLVAAAILIALAALIRFSEIGRTIRMVMSNQEMAQGLGINTTRVRQEDRENIFHRDALRIFPQLAQRIGGAIATG
jgi:hypothetical protein